MSSSQSRRRRAAASPVIVRRKEELEEEETHRRTVRWKRQPTLMDVDAQTYWSTAPTRNVELRFGDWNRATDGARQHVSFSFSYLYRFI